MVCESDLISHLLFHGMSGISSVCMGARTEVYLYDCIVTTALLLVITQGRDVNCFQPVLSIIVLRDTVVIHDMTIVDISVLAFYFAPYSRLTFQGCVVLVELQLKAVPFMQKYLHMLGQWYLSQLRQIGNNQCC